MSRDRFLVRRRAFGSYRYLSHEWFFDAWVAEDDATRFTRAQAERWCRLHARRYPHRSFRVVHA